jgi:sigma-E factor negative regulatory protein RseA
MSREALQESLSAVMDNEADELELRRVLNAFDDAETRDTWSRYQVARAVMHKDLLLPRLDIAAAVSAALADEAVPAKFPWSMAQPGSPGVAASVTVAVLAGVRLYNQDEIAGAELAQQTSNRSWPVLKSKARPFWQATRKARTPPGPWPMVCCKVNRLAGSASARLPAPTCTGICLKGTESALPYARAASLENR